MDADALLEKLSSGDRQAAEEVFRAYEPYLRMVVRRQLPENVRGKFDSSDIVQSIWADLLDGFRNAGWRFSDAAHLRAFLIQVTRNRFIDRLRQQRRALELERPLGTTGAGALPASADPRPSEVAQANDLWERLLALCPPAHRELLEMKRQGLSLADIASRTGLHPSSVRRILYDLARRLNAATLLSESPPDTAG
jgi:RNA polymerase sigma-70 factor (ECF subfamily)